MWTTERTLAAMLALAVAACPVPAGLADGGYNILPNADFAKVRSGYWPDWWNWYNALGNERIDLDECWQLVDDHVVPGTRSVRLSSGAQILSSFLRVVFQKGVPLTLSAWLRSDASDTAATYDEAEGVDVRAFKPRAPDWRTRELERQKKRQ